MGDETQKPMTLQEAVEAYREAARRRDEALAAHREAESRVAVAERDDEEAGEAEARAWAQLQAARRAARGRP